MMGKTFWISAFVHSLLLGALFFAPGMRRNVYIHRIQSVYLVKNVKKTSFKKPEATPVRKRIVLSSRSSLEMKNLKEKILERYKMEEKQKEEKPESRAEKKKEEQKTPLPKKKTFFTLPSQFPYPWYVSIIESQISSSWSPPSKLFIRQENVFAVVSFRILKDGTISRIKLKRSSGISNVDYSALQSMKVIKSLPPLPDGWKDDYLDVRVRLEVFE